MSENRAQIAEDDNDGDSVKFVTPPRSDDEDASFDV